MLTTSIQLNNGWLNKTSWESLTSVANILGVSNPSHNVVAIQSIATDQNSGITKFIVQNNGVWHINLATLNTLWGT
jgi:hypothetical protein